MTSHDSFLTHVSEGSPCTHIPTMAESEENTSCLPFKQFFCNNSERISSHNSPNQGLVIIRKYQSCFVALIGKLVLAGQGRVTCLCVLLMISNDVLFCPLDYRSLRETPLKTKRTWTAPWRVTLRPVMVILKL